MNKRSSSRFLLFSILLFLVLVGVGIYIQAPQKLLHRLVEHQLNVHTQEVFRDTLAVKKVYLDRHLQLTLIGVSAYAYKNDDPIALQVIRIQSLGPITNLLIQRPLLFQFVGLKLGEYDEDAINGTLRFQNGEHWNMRLEADVEQLSLDSLVWLNPTYLQGSTGKLTGVLHLALAADEAPELHSDLEVVKPGGKVRSNLFDLLAPYMPNKQQIQALIQSDKLVAYTTADLEIDWIKPEEVGVLLRMEVPTYNLNINLNIVIRVDNLQGVLQLMQLKQTLDN